MTTTTADIAPKLAGRIGECFNTALKKKKKTMGVVEDAGSTPEKVVATSSNLTKGDFNGSMEQTRDLVKSALVTNGRYGKYPYIIATYSDHVFVESDPSGPGEPTRFYTVPYTIKDNDVTLAEPTEVEKITKFVIKEIAESVLKDLLHEGGPGSGNWGHKGRPGKMGGSTSGGGKKSGDVKAHVVSGGQIVKDQHGVQHFIPHPKGATPEGVKKEVGSALKAAGGDKVKAVVKVGNQMKAMQRQGMQGSAMYANLKGARDQLRVGGPKSDILAHVVGTKGGQKVHASTFYDKSGGIARSQYSKLTPSQKQAVLSHGVSKYKEQYVPKAGQGKMSDADKATNAKVGGYEGMRRAALARAKNAPKGSSEWRSIMHIAIQMQQKVSQVKGSASVAGSKVSSAVFGAIRTAAASPAKGGR